ncbi:DUF721 domain-containing protein [Telmatocola sphagniphila]|jgi:hypothetical protein|uniref:DUF721 domain-containing protein n=1 Tax=Telmatocola sphagniphila TaxID=1123043 RepID=A0A8E6B4M2_9BACT|nr:DUF721 domain-containing protein [Telmatocola sphagniphila]QVL30423.1 DUF721 domain-containing protein [Telmatocola sphagniphila]
MKKPEPSGPEPLGDILARLFAARGFGRKQDRLRLERAFEASIDEEYKAHARPLNIRRGVLEIEVRSAVLMQELAQFHKRKLLESLRKNLQGITLNDLRFKAGVW